MHDEYTCTPLDIRITIGGFRESWVSVSEKGRRWTQCHAALVDDAPEGIEQDWRISNALIHHAQNDGLSVGVTPDNHVLFGGHPIPCLRWINAGKDS